MASEVQVETSPVGPVVRPPSGPELVVLYLHGDRHLVHPGGRARPGRPPRPVDGRRRGLRPLRGHLPGRAGRRARRVRLLRVQGTGGGGGRAVGAGLAAALLVRLRDLGAPPPLCGVLNSALLDLTLDSPSLLLNAAADPTFDVSELRRRCAHYAAGTSRTDPLLSPLHANLHGLPPSSCSRRAPIPCWTTPGVRHPRGALGVTVDLRIRPDATSLHPESVTAMGDFIRAWTPAARTAHHA